MRTRNLWWRRRQKHEMRMTHEESSKWSWHVAARLRACPCLSIRHRCYWTPGGGCRAWSRLCPAGHGIGALICECVRLVSPVNTNRWLTNAPCHVRHCSKPIFIIQLYRVVRSSRTRSGHCCGVVSNEPVTVGDLLTNSAATSTACSAFLHYINVFPLKKVAGYELRNNESSYVLPQRKLENFQYSFVSCVFVICYLYFHQARLMCDL